MSLGTIESIGMGFRDRLNEAGQKLKRELKVYRLVLRHPGTPRRSKLLLGIAVGYALMPFDLIPDFIPVVGHLDDVIVIPALVLLASRWIPESVLVECREAANAPDLP